MSTYVFFAIVGAVVFTLGIARLFQARDWIIRLLALNIASGGVLVFMVSLGSAGDVVDPVPQALALTGIVIMVAITGVGLVLARLVRLDEADETEDDA